MLYLNAMKISRNISEKRSVINCLLLAVLSAGIFLLHETGAGRPAIQKETIHVSMGFQGNSRTIPGIHELSISVKNPDHCKNSGFLILNSISKKLDTSVSLIISRSNKQLPPLEVNPTQHFRSRTLTSEESSYSFS
jgi:hypothetical protein